MVEAEAVDTEVSDEIHKASSKAVRHTIPISNRSILVLEEEMDSLGHEVPEDEPSNSCFRES